MANAGGIKTEPADNMEPVGVTAPVAISAPVGVHSWEPIPMDDLLRLAREFGGMEYRTEPTTIGREDEDAEFEEVSTQLWRGYHEDSSNSEADASEKTNNSDSE